jgi:hypothetical protein
MANRGYLCLGVRPSLYPSAREPAYDTAAQTVAASVNFVPVIWLAGFRAPDLLEDVAPSADGRDVPVVGLSTPRPTFLSRLEAGAALVAHTLGVADTALDEHARLLAEAVRARPSDLQHVSTELEEIWALRRDGLEGFAQDLSLALAGDRPALLRISGWDPAWRVPPARLFLEGRKVGRDEARAQDVLLGHGHASDVPWESPSPAEVPNPPVIAALLAKENERAFALVLNGADPNERTPRGSSSLLSIAIHRHPPLASALLDRGASPDDAALVAAAHTGSLELVKRLLALGANPKAQQFGETALTRACQSDDAEGLAACLTSAGADPNAGETKPLVAALERGQVELMKLLVDRGARVDVRDAQGRDLETLAKSLRRLASKLPAILALLEEARARP